MRTATASLLILLGACSGDGTTALPPPDAGADATVDSGPPACGCTIDGACRQSAETNPDDPCEVCRPEVDATAWTTLSCTEYDDACSDWACSPLTGACAGAPIACDDGDLCTMDACDPAAGCTSGVPLSCDDGVACTADACSPTSGCTSTADDSLCSDGDACTADACATGGCVHGAVSCDDGVACTLETCDAAVGCGSTPDDASCDDGVACTADACTAAGCVHGLDPTSCDDGNVCTVDECTEAAGCVSAPAAGPCDDGDPCTWSDACQGGGCAGVATGTCACAEAADCAAYDDGDACNGSLTCVAGVCTPDAAVTCDPASDSPCAQSTCDPATGSCAPAFAVDGTPCDDGMTCSDGETCQSGTCTAPAGATGCDCEADAECLASEDGDLCNGTLVCAQGHCSVDPASVPPPCDTSGDAACTTSSCQPETGACQPAATPDGSSCSDGLFCTMKDACTGGACAGQPFPCDDANPCTADACSEDAMGCAHVPAAGAVLCDDGDACTVDDACDGATCDGAPKDCGPSTEPCATPVCLAGGECGSKPVLGACDDGDPCTLADHCAEGGCTGTPKDCAFLDGACTAGACDATGACQPQAKPSGTPCSDGDPCTIDDVCQSAGCQGGPPLDCTALDTDCAAGTCKDGACTAVETGQCGMDTLPASGPELFAALKAGAYLGWEKESAVHGSSGPHSKVRVYVNAALAASLAAKAAAHPKGAAVVKELYDFGGKTVTGYAAMVKIQDGAAGGAGWFWYENFSTTTNSPVVSQPDAWCKGCHSGGSDYILIPYPLQ